MRAFAILAAGLVACGGAMANGANRAAIEPQIGTTAIPSTEHGKGVPVTEGGAYGERHDPSGWSGTSTLPTAVGGGPPTEKSAGKKPTETKPAEPKPVETKPAATPPAPKPVTPKASPNPAPSLPTTKDLDTSPPPKDLQF